jgi:hypothetical protein
MTTKELLDRLPPVETIMHDRTEAPPSRHQSGSVAFIALNHEDRDVLYSRPMHHHEEGDVVKATRAVRTARDGLQSFRATRHLTPSSLPDIVVALDQLCAKLNFLADSTEALSIFRACTVREESDSVETSLFNAIIHDMKATAAYFTTETSKGPAETPATLSEQECRKVKDMVDRYVTIVSTMLGNPKECVRIESNRIDAHVSC